MSAVRCHYEVLGVKREATNDDIKQAYRKMALKWHPDKNMSNVDQALHIFKEVQLAYEILIDPHERAFYDKHRESIIYGSNVCEKNSLNVYKYFNLKCFKGYADNVPQNFYQVYQNVFIQIATEDKPFCDKSDETQIPLFGNSTSPFEEVVDPFYSYWEGYCTKKTYTWLTNIEEIKQAPSRRIARLIEKEHEKICKNARKKRNEEVRELVAFVKKLDLRVAERKKYLEKLALEQKALQQAQLLEQKRKHLREYYDVKHTASPFIDNHMLEQEMAQLEGDVTAMFGDEEDQSSDDSQFEMEDLSSMIQKVDSTINNLTLNCRSKAKNKENDDENQPDVLDAKSTLYCLACNKLFKTVSSFKNHENSRKHRERRKFLIDENVITENENSLLNESIYNKDAAKNTMFSNQFEISNDKTATQHHDKTFSGQAENLSETIPKINPQTNMAHDFEKLLVTNGHINDDSITGHVDKPMSANNKTKINANLKQKTKGKSKSKELCCKICSEIFQSRNKLFDHIKSTGHAALKNVH